MRVDKIDTGILEALRENGRMANSEIAARLSVSEGTVRNRIAKLTSAGFLTVRGLVDPDMTEEKRVIFVGVKVAVSQDLERPAEAVSKLQGEVREMLVNLRRSSRSAADQPKDGSE